MSISTPGWSDFSGVVTCPSGGGTPTISGPSTPGGSNPPDCDVGVTPVDNLDCEGTRQSKLFVCGGVPPYSWSTTKGTVTPSTGTSTTLTPPTNPYVGAAGTSAYGITTKFISTFCTCFTSIWDCYETKIQTCLAINSVGCWQYCRGPSATCSCSNCGSATDAVCTTNPLLPCGKQLCSGGGCPESNSHCFCISTSDATCQPCPISMDGGAVVTVTDAIGQTDVDTVYPSPRTTL